MWLFDPLKFAGSSEDWLLSDGFMDAQKSRMEFALANAALLPAPEALISAVEHIADEASIILSTEELSQILTLYPMERGKLASYGFGDTDVREQIMGVVANFMGNTRWPMGKDKVDIVAFLANLRAAAKFMGYKISDMVD